MASFLRTAPGPPRPADQESATFFKTSKSQRFFARWYSAQLCAAEVMEVGIHCHVLRVLLQKPLWPSTHTHGLT